MATIRPVPQAEADALEALHLASERAAAALEAVRDHVSWDGPVARLAGGVWVRLVATVQTSGEPGSPQPRQPDGGAQSQSQEQ